MNAELEREEREYQRYVAARVYDGSFPLEWLRPGEFVRRGPRGEADIEAQDGTLLHRIAVGERVP